MKASPHLDLHYWQKRGAESRRVNGVIRDRVRGSAAIARWLGLHRLAERKTKKILRRMQDAVWGDPFPFSVDVIREAVRVLKYPERYGEMPSAERKALEEAFFGDLHRSKGGLDVLRSAFVGKDFLVAWHQVFERGPLLRTDEDRELYEQLIPYLRDRLKNQWRTRISEANGGAAWLGRVDNAVQAAKGAGKGGRRLDALERQEWAGLVDKAVAHLDRIHRTRNQDGSEVARNEQVVAELQGFYLFEGLQDLFEAEGQDLDTRYPMEFPWNPELQDIAKLPPPQRLSYLLQRWEDVLRDAKLHVFTPRSASERTGAAEAR